MASCEMSWQADPCDGLFYLMDCSIWWAILSDGLFCLMDCSIWWTVLSDGVFYLMGCSVWWAVRRPEEVENWAAVGQCTFHHSHFPAWLGKKFLPKNVILLYLCCFSLCHGTIFIFLFQWLRCGSVSSQYRPPEAAPGRGIFLRSGLSPIQLYKQSWARDNSVATMWPCFQGKKLFVIAILRYLLWLPHVDTEA